jgi:RNA polymerase sigma factor for flagellar operon FliA
VIETTVSTAAGVNPPARYRAPPGSAAEGELVREYLPLVRTVVGRLALTLPAHVDQEDLLSAGTVGLLNALRNFDASNGASFATYARIRIQGAVLDELRRMDCVSRGVRDKARQVQAVWMGLEQRHGRPPTEAEMAAALQLSPAEYAELLDEIRPVTFVCLDAATQPEAGEDGLPAAECIADPGQDTPGEGAARRELAQLIAARIRQLPEIQRKVLALYYFEDLRLREIAEAFGVTESRICQIHAQAILAIRSFLQQQERGMS